MYYQRAENGGRSIAACVETFFRDIYFYLLRRNPKLLQKVLESGSGKVPARHLPLYVAEGVAPEEFAAFQASFQNAESINRNISIFFSSPFFNILDQFEIFCDIPSARRNGPARLKLFSCWQSDLSRIFSLRHEFAHDANSKTEVDILEMRRIETTALLICQLTALLPGVEASILVSNRQLPAIFLIKDLVSEDWESAGDEHNMP